MLRNPGGGGSRATEGALSQSGQPFAIVAIVIILGACAYLWYIGYLRSRAAFVALALVIGFLIYFGFFYGYPPT